jgi:cold shock CspA family protein
LQAVVKKWFRETDTGVLDNGNGPDITVGKADLIGCRFLKVGATVDFECHPEKQGLVARKVKLSNQNKPNGKKSPKRAAKPFRFGVMT